MFMIATCSVLLNEPCGYMGGEPPGEPSSPEEWHYPLHVEAQDEDIRILTGELWS
jgi:hypothetical protein